MPGIPASHRSLNASEFLLFFSPFRFLLKEGSRPRFVAQASLGFLVLSCLAPGSGITFVTIMPDFSDFFLSS